MAMSTFHLLPLAIILTFFFTQQQILCAVSPSSSPSPAPALPADAPSPSINISSPPAPPPYSDLSPTPATSTSPSPTPTPAPAPGIGGISHAGVADVEADEEHSDGMSAGKKAGIAIGVIACISFVVLGAFMYKKRQSNIQRSQYSTAARREFL